MTDVPQNGGDEVPGENYPDETVANRIMEIMEQITECLDDDEIVDVNTMISEVNALVKKRGNTTANDFDNIYLRFLELVEFRSGISVYLIKQAITSFMIMEEDRGEIGKKVAEMFQTMMLSEYPSVGIDMQLSDELLKVYFSLLKEAYEEIQHIRLMVVGTYGVGKTTLVNRLCGKPKKKEDIKSTVVIDIFQDLCEVKDDLDWEISDPKRKEKLLNERLQELVKEYKKPNTQQSAKQSSTSKQSKSQTRQSLHASTASRDEPSFESFREKVGEIDQKKPAGEKIMDDLKEMNQKEIPKRRPTVSIWDFAGQSVYYSTHHFFLNARSIYLVVLDLSKSLHDKVEEDNEMDVHQNLLLGCTTGYTCLDTFKFWMRSIYIYTKQKKTSEYEYKPKIVLVGTFKDKIILKGGKTLERYKEEYFKEALLHFEGSRILDLVHPKKFLINNHDQEEADFLEIKQEIYHIARRMPFWNEKVPSKFIPLERSIFQSKQEGREIMEFSELQEVGENVEYPQADADEITLFLKFQHAFGSAIYYNIPNFDEMVILTPQWIINAFKAFITHTPDKDPRYIKSREKFEKTGILDEQRIDALLSEKFAKYKEEIKKYMECLDVIVKPVEFKEDLESDEPHSLSEDKYFFIDGTMHKQTQATDFYVMPCMLPQRPDVEILKQMLCFKETEATPTLCLLIKQGLLPSFVIHFLLAIALKEMPISIRSGKKLLYNGLGSFQLTPSRQVTIWADDNIIHLRVTFQGSVETNDNRVGFCRNLFGRFEELILKLFNFNRKDTYEQPSDLFDILVKCPKCPEQVPFDVKIDKETGKSVDYRIGLFDVENLQIVKEHVCGCCNELIKAKEAMHYWFASADTTEESATQEDDELSMACQSDDILKTCCQSDEMLIWISRMIKEKHCIELAVELKMLDQSHERRRMETPKEVSVEYYFLFTWKKSGECWKMLHDAMKNINIEFDTNEFLRIIKKEDSEEYKKRINERFDEVPEDLIHLSEIMTEKLVNCIGKEYWYFGLTLGIGQVAMERIEKTYSKVEDRIREILCKWNKETTDFKELIRAITLTGCDWSIIRPILNDKSLNAK